MKKLVLLVFAIVIMSPFVEAKDDIIMEKIHATYESDPKVRRSRPVKQHSSVECYYQDGVITIEFETTEGDATFTVTDVVTGDNASTMFNTAMEFNYFIGSEPSTYLLEISTYEGNNYEGYLTID